MYKKQDQEMLAEAYDIVQEGLVDRWKARGAQAVGTIRGAGQQLAGKAQQAAGGLISKAGKYAAQGVEAVGGTLDPSKNRLAQAGERMEITGADKLSAGKRAGTEAKYESYIKNSAETIANDLDKLGMPVFDKNELISDIMSAISKNLK